MNHRMRPSEFYKQPSEPGQAVAVSRQAQHPMEAALHWLEGTMSDHPRTSLIAAAAAGVLLGWIVKRR
jgi:ElaB/YqjD/DUF883 family membrane-anchored ribosome-binding protein